MINYVFYDDTDCGGIVYHSNYITFCERARSLIFFEHGIYPHTLDEKNPQGFVVRNVECDYFYPLRFADKYEIKSEVTELKHTSLKVKQEIYKIGSIRDLAIESSTDSKDSIESNPKEVLPILSFKAIISLAYIDLATKKPHKIPQILRDILVKYSILS